DASGTAPLPNGNIGINLHPLATGVSGNLIGGMVSGAGNRIAFNVKGVAISGATSNNNAILGNAIFGNSSIGIDLGNDGVTPNDAAGHNGPNGFQNVPVLTQVVASTVFGNLHSTPNTQFRIEFFANDAFDPSGSGEGQVFLGFVNVVTDANGFAAFSFAFASD